MSPKLYYASIALSLTGCDESRRETRADGNEAPIAGERAVMPLKVTERETTNPGQVASAFEKADSALIETSVDADIISFRAGRPETIKAIQTALQGKDFVDYTTVKSPDLNNAGFLRVVIHVRSKTDARGLTSYYSIYRSQNAKEVLLALINAAKP